MPDVAIAVMPNRGSILPDAAQAFFAQPTRGGLQVAASTLGMSILELGFNRLWCDALNSRDVLKPKYFAMLHDDVCPEPFWLDKLIAELEAHDADVVSAVVPLKDHYGLTSTAVGCSDDPWSTTTRRISMTEAMELPVTFSRDDLDWPTCGDCLFINSGCWVCRFDSPWVEQIVWRMESRNECIHGTWAANTISEDWLFGCDVHKLGLKVMSTRAVKLYHGKEWCHNHSAWGAWEIDRLWQTHEGYRQLKGKFDYPEEVDGWLTPTEGYTLTKLSEGKRVLEIGSYCGKSTICIAQAAQGVVAVDPHDGRATPRPKSTLAELRSNLAEHGVVDRVEIVVGTVDDVSGEFDVIFIDGDHSYEAVKNDIERSLEMLAPGGVLAFHDYRDNGRDPEVRQAVDEFLAESGSQLAGRFDSLAVVHPQLTAPLA